MGLLSLPAPHAKPVEFHEGDDALEKTNGLLAPLEKRDALDMMQEIKARKILDQVRGMPPADLDQLADILIEVGNIGLEQEDIKEIDINPVILKEGKPVAVDALVVLNSQTDE